MAQNNYYFIVETQTVEEIDGPLKHQSTYTVSFKNGIIQTFSEDAESTEYRYYSKDTVYISYRNKNGKEVKGLGTGDEMKNILNNEVDHKRKGIKMHGTGNRDIVMGLLCNEAVVSYQYKYLVELVRLENSIWYNSEKNVDQELITADLSSIWIKNDYIDSLKKLNSFILKQVIKHDNVVITTMEVIDFQESNVFDLRQAHYSIRPKKIKKLKSCIRHINSLRKAGKSFERLNATQN